MGRFSGVQHKFYKNLGYTQSHKFIKRAYYKALHAKKNKKLIVTDTLLPFNHLLLKSL